MSANFSPTLQPYKETGAFRYWCQHVIPLVYDDSLSYYELLCKVVNYLNDVISNVDGLHTDVEDLLTAYNELQDYVNNYFSDLNVQTQIDNKLDKMAQDGTLANIINEEIFNNLNNEINTLTESVNNNTTKIEDIENQLSTSKNIFLTNSGNCSGIPFFIDEAPDGTSVQGGCFDGTYWYQLFLITDTANCILRKYSSTGIVSENTIAAFHGNDAKYYNGKIYIAGGNNADLSPNKNIIVVNPNTLTVEQTINCNVAEGVGVGGICFYNNECYIMTWSAQPRYIYKVDLSTGNTTYVTQFQANENLSWTQSIIEYDGEYFYCGYINPPSIYCFDNNGNPVNTFNFNNKIEGCCPCGEIEGLCFYGNNAYVSFTTNTGTNVFCVAMINLKYNTPSFLMDTNGVIATTLTVDGSFCNTNNIYSRKFKNIRQAYYYMLSLPAQTYYYTVNINDTGNLKVDSSAYNIVIQINSSNRISTQIRVICGYVTITGNLYWDGDDYMITASGSNSVYSTQCGIMIRGTIYSDSAAHNFINGYRCEFVQLDIAFDSSASNLKSTFDSTTCHFLNFSNYDAGACMMYTGNYGTNISGLVGNGVWFRKSPSIPYAVGGVLLSFSDLGISGLVYNASININIGGYTGSGVYGSGGAALTIPVLTSNNTLVICKLTLPGTGIKVQMFKLSGSSFVECSANEYTISEITIQ